MTENYRNPWITLGLFVIAAIVGNHVIYRAQENKYQQSIRNAKIIDGKDLQIGDKFYISTPEGFVPYDEYMKKQEIKANKIIGDSNSLEALTRFSNDINDITKKMGLPKEVNSVGIK